MKDQNRSLSVSTLIERQARREKTMKPVRVDEKTIILVPEVKLKQSAEEFRLKREEAERRRIKREMEKKEEKWD